jgi:hypothetical protein
MRLLWGFLLMALSLAALAAPKAEPWERWAAHAQNKAGISHKEWNDFLAHYLKAGSDGISRVAYGAVTPADRTQLGKYLEKLQDVKITQFARAEQRAYWINLYNATTVKVVLDHYPVASITKINLGGGFFAKGPWKKKLLAVEGEPVSLDDIEHRILRPLWQDPRTHYALNCASLGCPNLPPKAFTPGNTEALLDEGAKAYVNHPRGARVENGRLTVSSIYVWFRADFGGDEAGVIAHLKKYADAELKKRLAKVDGIDDDEYDWSLNGAP